MVRLLAGRRLAADDLLRRLVDQRQRRLARIQNDDVVRARCRRERGGREDRGHQRAGHAFGTPDAKKERGKHEDSFEKIAAIIKRLRRSTVDPHSKKAAWKAHRTRSAQHAI